MTSQNLVLEREARDITVCLERMKMTLREWKVEISRKNEVSPKRIAETEELVSEMERLGIEMSGLKSELEDSQDRIYEFSIPT